MISPEKRVGIASKLTKSAVDLQKWSGKEISIVYPMLPISAIAASILGYELTPDPNGFILVGGILFLYVEVAEGFHIVGRMKEGCETVPISDWLLPKVASPIMKGIANLIRPADKQTK